MQKEKKTYPKSETKPKNLEYDENKPKDKKKFKKQNLPFFLIFYETKCLI